MEKEVRTFSPEETISLGENLGRLLIGGEIILLEGPLGSGKTIFVKGVAKGLDVPSSIYVKSPSFTLLHIYHGRLSLYHFDLFRIKSVEDLDTIGFEEYFDKGGVIIVEWGKMLSSILNFHLEIIFEFGNEKERKIAFKGSEDLIKKVFS